MLSHYFRLLHPSICLFLCLKSVCVVEPLKYPCLVVQVTQELFNRHLPFQGFQDQRVEVVLIDFFLSRFIWQNLRLCGVLLHLRLLSDCECCSAETKCGESGFHY